MLKESSDKSTQLLLFTDAHCYYDEPYEICSEYVPIFQQLKEAYDHCSFEFCLSAGDFVNWGEVVTPDMGFRQIAYNHGTMESLFKKYKPCMGNHEYAFYQGYSNVLTESQIKNAYMPEYERLYYTFENANNKFIVLQTGIDGDHLISSTQKSWMKQQLKNATKDIVIVEHIAFDGSNESVSTAFVPKVFVDLEKEFDNFNKRVGEYSGCNRKILCVLSGHTHFYKHKTTTSGIQVVAFDRLLHGSTTNYYGIIIDNQNKKLKIAQTSGSNIEYVLP